MNITIENKKAKAIELMKKLDIYKPYIKGFETFEKSLLASFTIAFSPFSVTLPINNNFFLKTLIS